MLKKFRLEDSKPMKTPMSIETKLTKVEEGESVDNTKYRGMIRSLLYLTASRPDIMFSVCLCARFQEDPKTSHLEAVKRIFRYVKGTTHLGLWYPKGSGIETIVYADSDHARDYMDRKSTSVITEYLVNISKRRAFWSLNEDILKITILTTNTPKISNVTPTLRNPNMPASRLKKIPYEVMAELISEEYIMNAQNESNLSITYNDISIELSKEFLVELHKNAYHRWIDEDIMDHIAKVLEMIDLIYIPGVDSHQLRMKIFPLSLADDARQ
ncbi:hypothetical protein Tco_1560752 [Tanacetum coccineum]